MVKNKIRPKRKIIRRTCTGCGKVKEKKEMLRIVRTQDSDIKRFNRKNIRKRRICML